MTETFDVRQAVQEYFDRHSGAYNPDELDFRGVKLVEAEREYIEQQMRRYQLTFDLVPKLASAKVLDVGPAYGHLDYCIKKFLGYDITAADVRTSQLRYWKERIESEGMQFKILDVTNEVLPFPDESFDIVLLLEVVEHLFPPKAFQLLKEVRRVLKKGDTLIVSTPNQAWIGHRLALLKGKPVLELKAYYVNGGGPGDSYGHIFEYTGADLKKLLETADFVVQRVDYWNFFAPPGLRLKMMRPFETRRMRDSMLVKAGRT